MLHILILHQTTTHVSQAISRHWLLHIFILHQTTTIMRKDRDERVLLHILILHQTTTTGRVVLHIRSCFIFWFYIKPQLQTLRKARIIVASYFDSTSNHNTSLYSAILGTVASYFDSTSNHNKADDGLLHFQLLHILILHQTTTSQGVDGCKTLLLHILILHQTTTLLWLLIILPSCFIFWFYIKPQR